MAVVEQKHTESVSDVNAKPRRQSFINAIGRMTPKMDRTMRFTGYYCNELATKEYHIAQSKYNVPAMWADFRIVNNKLKLQTSYHYNNQKTIELVNVKKLLSRKHHYCEELIQYLNATVDSNIVADQPIWNKLCQLLSSTTIGAKVGHLVQVCSNANVKDEYVVGVVLDIKQPKLKLDKQKYINKYKNILIGYINHSESSCDDPVWLLNNNAAIEVWHSPNDIELFECNENKPFDYRYLQMKSQLKDIIINKQCNEIGILKQVIDAGYEQSRNILATKIENMLTTTPASQPKATRSVAFDSQKFLNKMKYETEMKGLKWEHDGSNYVIECPDSNTYEIIIGEKMPVNIIDPDYKTMEIGHIYSFSSDTIFRWIGSDAPYLQIITKVNDDPIAINPKWRHIALQGDNGLATILRYQKAGIIPGQDPDNAYNNHGNDNNKDNSNDNDIEINDLHNE